jgi:integrase
MPLRLSHRGPIAHGAADLVRVPIYRTRWRSKKTRRTYRTHVIVWRDRGLEHREKHSDLAAAQARADRIAGAIANGEIALLSFSHADRAELLEVRRLCPPGKTIVLAAAEYSQAMAALAGRASLLDAVQFYLSHQPAEASPRTVDQVYTEMLVARAQDGLSQNTLADYRSRLGRFAREFDACPLSALDSRHLDDWLRRLDVHRRTRNNYRGNLLDFVRFARRRGYMPKDWDPLDQVPRLKNEPVQIDIFTPEELTKLLGAAPANQLPFIAIGAFAGLRHEEMSAPGLPVLDWRQVDFDKNEIHVLAAVARKKGYDRLVPMSQNLRAWLEPHARHNGPICALANMANALRRTAAAAAVPWKRNGLRRSFISYQLAMSHNIGTVATEAGTSPDRIRHNYRKLVPDREALRYFAILPTSNDILQLPLPLAYAHK